MTSPFHFRHRWTIVSQTEQPSPAEIARSIGAALEAFWGATPLVTRPIIVTQRCATCGKERVFRV